MSRRPAARAALANVVADNRGPVARGASGASAAMVNFNRVIQWIVVGISLYLLWATLRWIVLPHLKIFPYIPPEALWVNAYNVLAAFATAAFWMVLAFLIALWAVWKVVKKFVPYTIMGIPFGKKILRSSPLREFTDAGIIPLIDDIYKALVDMFIKFVPFKTTLKAIWAACQKFYRNSLSYVFKNIRTEYRIDEILDKERNRKRKRHDVTIPEKGPYEPDDEDPEDAAATADENLMRKEVEDDYLQCVDESTIAVAPDATATDRAYAAVRNGATRTMCGMRKMRTYATLMEYREL